MEVQAAPVLRERTRVECHEGILKGLIRHSTDRMGKTQTTGMPEKQRKTKDLSLWKALTLHSDPWHAHRTKDHTLTNNKEEQVNCHLWPSLVAERQVHDSQRWRQGAATILAPKTIFPTKL